MCVCVVVVSLCQKSKRMSFQLHHRVSVQQRFRAGSSFKAPTFWQTFLVVQTQYTVSIWIHNGVPHPGYLFDEFPYRPSVSGEKPVSEITKHFRNQKQGDKPQNEIGQFQVGIKHTEDGIGFNVRASFREENGGRHIRGHPVGLAQFLGQVRLDRCESKMIQGITFDDKPGQEFSHATPTIVQKQGAMVALLVHAQQSFGRLQHVCVSLAVAPDDTIVVAVPVN